MVTEEELLRYMRKNLLNDIEKALKEDRKWCCICRFAKEITVGPSPSGRYAGVECTHPKMLEEYGEVGDSVNLFRIEVIDDNADCEVFEKNEENKIEELRKKLLKNQ